MDRQVALPSFLRFDAFPLHWQMAEPEKAALLQLLDSARPEVALEIGTYQGGSLQALSSRAAKVYSIDTDPTVAQKLQPRFAQVDFRTGPSAVLLPQILKQISDDGERLGFVLVDGDHSRLGVRRDLELLFHYVPRRSLYVVCHDSFNPECRRGIVEADWAASPYVHYVEVDFVAGAFFPHAADTAQAGSMWGGLALAVFLPEPRQGPLVIRQAQQSVFEAVYQRSCHHPRRFLVRKVLRKIKRRLVG